MNGTESHAQITVNLPADDTVNGYRTENSKPSEMPDAVSAEDVKPAEPDNAVKAADYIGNSNSHIFHKPSCSSANTIKGENRVSFKSREDAVKSGYAPCKRCKP